jgi:hypothetical protein
MDSMRGLALVLPLLLIACGSSDSGGTIITIGEAKYAVPDRHIRSLTRKPHQFVRINRPDSSFELVYDSRTAARRDRRGWPIIFSLNDERAPNVHRYSNEDLMVVCRQAVNPEGGCGLKVSHRGAEWTVLFPSDHLIAAGIIRERALAALAAYEV